MNATQDFAERIKKFYYYRALLCEKLIDRKVTVTGDGIELPPAEFNPFNNFYVDAYVIGFAALDSLASIWQSVNQFKFSGNRERFTAFLIDLDSKMHIDLDSKMHMERICTPFLVFFLNKQGIETPFAKEIESKWLNNRSARESHRIYDDPTIPELKTVYTNCHQKHPISEALSLKNPDYAIQTFTYAALIYKFYRCSFVHEFRSSQFATFFNKGNQISVREFSSSNLSSGLATSLEGVKPQLDVGIGVLTESIRKGADIIYNSIMEKQYTDIPYGSNDEVHFKVKKPR